MQVCQAFDVLEGIRPDGEIVGSGAVFGAGDTVQSGADRAGISGRPSGIVHCRSVREGTHRNTYSDDCRFHQPDRPRPAEIAVWQHRPLRRIDIMYR